MNKIRRQKLAKWLQDLEEIKVELEEILSDEEYSYNSMPEGLQYSIRGRESEDAIDQMNDAVESIADAVQSVYRIV